MDKVELQKTKTKRYIGLAILLLFMLSSLGYYFYRTNEQVVKFANLKYGANSSQTLDVFTPKDPIGKLPVIIYVHGGGWTGGDKENVAEKPAFFVNKGYVFVSVNYQLYPKATYQTMANDISLAVKWINQNRYKYHIDGSRINLMGHSAGGHLVMLIGTNPQYLNRVGLSPQSLVSIVNLEGPVDLPEFLKRLGNYKKVFGQDEKVWTEASPVTYAAAKNLPPMFFVTRRKSAVSNFLLKAKKAGNTAEVFECKSLSHSGVTQMLGSSKGNAEAKQMTNTVVKFLQSYNR